MRLALRIGLLILMGGWPLCSRADHLSLTIGDRSYELDGEILIEAQDQSLYFRENNGRIWFVKPEQIRLREDSDEPVEPISKDALGEKLLAELPDGFRIYETKHYVIAYQTELAYARWVGGLYESRLYRGFETFWKRRKKFDLTEPEFPMAVIIYGSQAQYQQHLDRELGPGQSLVAYYNLETNRVTMFDLTASAGVPGQSLDDRKIEQILANPGAVLMVATMIHEGTHQLMFNRGLQTRFADTPLWLNEGLAMFFEAPDLRSKRGWQKPGLIFEQRLTRFLQGMSGRSANSLQRLITDDSRLRDSETALDAYAEAWALNHFLLNRRSDQYVAYLEHMAAKEPLKTDSPEQRLQEFKQFLGEDLEQLNADFVDYIRNLN